MLSPHEAPLFEKGARVLFQGDSITDMGRGRTDDPNHLLGHGYAFIIAAMEAARYPERNVAFINRGIGGDDSRDLAARWQTDALDLQPDVLSLLVGVNDLGHAFRDGYPLSVEEYEATCDQLLAGVLAVSPHLKIILGEPFLTLGTMSASRFEERRETMRQIQAAVRKLAEKYRAPLVPYQAMFEDAARRVPIEHWIWDGVHPTFAGHQLMADEWRRVYRDFYGAPRREVPSLPDQMVSRLPSSGRVFPAFTGIVRVRSPYRTRHFPAAEARIRASWSRPALHSIATS